MKIGDIKAGAVVSERRGRLAIVFIVLAIIVSGGIFVVLWNGWHNTNNLLFNKYYNISWYVVWVVSGITFSFWFHRSYANLKLMGISKTKWDPLWAVLGVWVIVANLFLPYIIMKEINTLSAEKNNKPPNNFIVSAWWIALLTSVFIGWIASAHTNGHVTYDEFKTGTVLHFIRYAFFLLSGVILIKLIASINHYQKAFSLLTEKQTDIDQ